MSDRLLADWIALVEAKRAELGWSQEKLGLEAGLGADYWGKVVRGEKDNPTFETIRKVNSAAKLWLMWNIAPAE